MEMSGMANVQFLHYDKNLFLLLQFEILYLYPQLTKGLHQTRKLKEIMKIIIHRLSTMTEAMNDKRFNLNDKCVLNYTVLFFHYENYDHVRCYFQKLQNQIVNAVFRFFANKVSLIMLNYADKKFHQFQLHEIRKVPFRLEKINMNTERCPIMNAKHTFNIFSAY